MSCSEKPGVYFLFRNQQLAYVGRSRNPKGRIDVHRKNGRPFDHSLHVECAPDDVAWIERALIAALNPPQNRLGVVDPREEQPAAPITQIIYHRPPPEPPKADPHKAISVTHARDQAKARGLRVAFEEDFRSGKLPSYPKNPQFDGPGKPRYVTRGELDAWFEEARQARANAGWRT